MSTTYRTKLWPIWVVAITIAVGVSQTGSSADSANTNRAPLKYEEPTLLTGTIHPTDSRQPQALFKFKRVATRSGSRLEVLREYTYPDGKPAARERMVYEGNELVSYALDELQIGAAGAVKVHRDPNNPAASTLAFEYTKALASGSKPKTSTESLRADTLTGDMVAAFLSSHWNDLSNGQSVKCRYVVVPRRETVGFTFNKESETTSRGRRVAIIRMAPTSPIIARLVDPLFFTVEQDGQHRVLQYVGRVTPKTRIGNKWEDLDGTFIFDWPAR